MVSRDGDMPRQQQQQQPLQQPLRGIPPIGGDGEDGSTPRSETFSGGDGGAVEEWLQSENVEMSMFSLSEGPQQSAPTAVALAAAAPAAEAVTDTSVFPAVSSKESFNEWGGRGCHIFVAVLGQGDTKIAPPGDIFDPPLVK